MTLSVSHYDLDGISCQIPLYRTFDVIKKMNISYKDVDNYITIIDDFCFNNKPARVFVTDLSFTFSQLKDLYRVTNRHKEVMFYFIDHHPFDEDFSPLQSKNLKIIISDKASATKLTYMFLIKNFDLTPTDELTKYVEYVNSYDIWLEDKKEFKVGFVFNELFWKYKPKMFWSKFKDDASLQNSDKEVYKELMQKKAKLFDKIKQSGRLFELGNKDLFMIFVDDFKSHIPFDYPGYKIYVLLSSNGSVSIRLKDCQNSDKIRETIINNSLKHKNVSSSGGHPNAFGITLIDNKPHEMIEFAKFLIDTISNVI